MIEEVKTLEWRRCGAFFMSHIGYNDGVVTLYAGADIVTFGKLEVINGVAGVIKRGSGIPEERIRVLRISDGWITLKRVAKVTNEGLDFGVNFLYGYSSDYDDDEEEERALTIVIASNEPVFIEYRIHQHRNEIVSTAYIDMKDGRIIEFPGLPLEVAAEAIKE